MGVAPPPPGGNAGPGQRGVEKTAKNAGSGRRRKTRAGLSPRGALGQASEALRGTCQCRVDASAATTSTQPLSFLQF